MTYFIFSDIILMSQASTSFDSPDDKLSFGAKIKAKSISWEVVCMGILLIALIFVATVTNLTISVTLSFSLYTIAFIPLIV